MIIMDAETKSTEKSILEKIAGKLMKAQQELDELAVQFALGKAEAKDKFEDIKKDFGTHIAELKHSLKSTVLKEMVSVSKAKFEELELQLALGKAETAEAFEIQSKKILKSLQTLEDEIKEKFPQTAETNSFNQEIEAFKLKIEILRLKFVLKQFEVKDTFKDKMRDASKVIDKLKNSAKEKLESGKEKYDDFKDEVQLAYKHLRKALDSL
jgi:hypothetical protein